MPNGLSYLALRCVLENLDAMKRLHITARSPALKRIDNRIPLNIRSIDIAEQYVGDSYGNGYMSLAVCINDVSIALYKQELVFNKSGSQVCRREVPLGRTEKYLHYYLGLGRSKVSVNKFSIDLFTFTPPAGMQDVLTINEFCVNCGSDFRGILSIINTESFPLKMFTAELSDLSNLNHSIVHSSKHLVLSRNNGKIPNFLSRVMLRLARQFRNKDILFNCMLWEHDGIIENIKYWIENRKPIGAKYSFLFADNRLPEVLNKLWQEFNNMQDVNERVSSFDIPINSQSKICVYGVDEPQRLVIEVVPTTDSV